ncbi:hypothetical protein GIB67_004412 [Kingdonia uniflora]|uniref:Nucleotide-diphospho-sugar transferase domain-containing protein n=1 Tax=Kingdonia uniflora TaxID=39325 RepID=A0A7J7MRJ5_9MAGN|nr:hypothetical protein GIB67_004412 [Kingdonia uniflora]
MRKTSSTFSSFSYNNKTLQVGLWSVWVSGFILIVISLYATQRLPFLKDPKLISNKGEPNTPNVTIFSAPSSFTGSVGTRQVLAIRSWLALSPKVNVVLFGRDPYLVSFAGALGHRVAVESDIDFTFLGTPFFHSMVARSRASHSDISVLIDPDTVLLPDFMSTLIFANKLDHDWLLIATSPNVSQFKFHLDGHSKCWLRENGEGINVKKLQDFVAQKRQWGYFDGRMLMAWNTGELPLHAGVLPPFLYGKGLHYQWIINEALSSDFRFVFDASGAISSFYPDDLGNWAKPDINEKRSWEYRDTAENVAYPYRDQSSSSLWKGRILRSRREKKWMNCVKNIKSLERNLDSELIFELSIPLSIPFSLETLLSLAVDKDRTIVLAVAGNSYRDMLLSWVCRLRHLQVSNFVVCALDNEIYQFSVLQGLPVFKDPLAPSNISFNDCHFGTECFQRVTKVKSRLVLQILKMGYNVLLSDVDVYWFKNPLPFVSSFGHSTLVVQSDEYNETGPINLPRRLNSGFYFAHSDGVTITAMEKVVKHASTSALSEQPSFYDVLCGEGGVNRLGDDRCFEPETNLTVQFLDRNLFPNGAYRNLWEKANVRAACEREGCIILHNNWINGRRRSLNARLARCVKGESRKKKALNDALIISDLDAQQKDMNVRIVHAGRLVELYADEISASEVMEMHPGMCVTRPEVFKRPHECILQPEEKLLPGQKFYLVPHTILQKLKRKHPEKVQVVVEGEVVGIKLNDRRSEKKVRVRKERNYSEDYMFYAKDFYLSNERWSECVLRRREGELEKAFSPPIKRPRVCHGFGWRPSLASVKEVSP